MSPLGPLSLNLLPYLNFSGASKELYPFFSPMSLHPPLPPFQNNNNESGSKKNSPNTTKIPSPLKNNWDPQDPHQLSPSQKSNFKKWSSSDEETNSSPLEKTRKNSESNEPLDNSPVDMSERKKSPKSESSGEESEIEVDVGDSDDLSTIGTTTPSPDDGDCSVSTHGFSKFTNFTNYHPLNSLSQHATASLFFSIANILRPDFGLAHAQNMQNLHKNLAHAQNFYKNSPSHPPQTKNPSLGPKNSGVLPHKLSGKREREGEKLGGRDEKVKKFKRGVEGEVSVKNSPIDLSSPPPSSSESVTNEKEKDGETLWPAWVYCTRYSDRPSSGPRTRRSRKQKEKEIDEKRPRTAFTSEQLSRLKREFDENRYLTEKRRQDLANELQLHENQIKIWFQNKRAKLKKSTGQRGGLAMQLMAQGLYNHSTIPPRGCGDDDDDDEDSDQ